MGWKGASLSLSQLTRAPDSCHRGEVRFRLILWSTGKTGHSRASSVAIRAHVSFACGLNATSSDTEWYLSRKNKNNYCQSGNSHKESSVWRPTQCRQSNFRLASHLDPLSPIIATNTDLHSGSSWKSVVKSVMLAWRFRLQQVYKIHALISFFLFFFRSLPLYYLYLSSSLIILIPHYTGLIWVCWADLHLHQTPIYAYM